MLAPVELPTAGACGFAPFESAVEFASSCVFFGCRLFAAFDCLFFSSWFRRFLLSSLETELSLVKCSSEVIVVLLVSAFVTETTFSPFSGRFGEFCKFDGRRASEFDRPANAADGGLAVDALAESGDSGG